MSATPEIAFEQAHHVGEGRSAEVFADRSGRVLKLYKAKWGKQLAKKEFVATSFARSHGLRVPAPLGIIEQDGRSGVIFEHIYGKTVLEHFKNNPLGMLGALRKLAVIQYRIHKIENPPLPDQQDAIRIQVSRARVPSWLKQTTLVVLDRLPDGNRLCHGDLHPENVLYTSEGLVVIDWEKSTSGHPAADVARTDLIIRCGRVGETRTLRKAIDRIIRKALAEFYIRQYCQLSMISRQDVMAWRLPMLVARLSGQVAANEHEIQAEASELGTQFAHLV
ncbi:phosphotransferase family protein [Methylobacterium sp.]|uniref:phosphotransferase family protein n=1 Tax=Methylobacterium sp. TaxID=409 RepID=UPI003B02B4E2